MRRGWSIVRSPWAIGTWRHDHASAPGGALRWLVIIAVCAALAIAQAGSAHGAARPNFVFIMGDDLDTASLGAMPQTRRLIGEEGVRFTSYYVGVSLCCPSRATILTGKYAHNTKVLANRGERGGFRAFDVTGNERSTLATWLSARGYRTGHIGKYLNGFPGARGATYVPPGWDYWVVPVAGQQYRQYNYTLNANGLHEWHGTTAADYGTDVFGRKALDFIEQAAADGVPFYLQLWGWAPHGPYTPAPRHASLFPYAQVKRDASFFEADTSDKPAIMPTKPYSGERALLMDQIHRQRLRSLVALDELVQAIHDRLRRLGLLGSTYLIFSSDNGFHLGQHGLLAGKSSAYEEDVRVPLMIRGPGIPRGLVLDHLLSNADLAPTVADLAGVEADPKVDGRSFAGLLDGQGPAPGDWRSLIPLAHWDDPTALFDYLPDFRGLRSRRYTYVEYAHGRTRALRQPGRRAAAREPGWRRPTRLPRAAVRADRRARHLCRRHLPGGRAAGDPGDAAGSALSHAAAPLWPRHRAIFSIG